MIFGAGLVLITLGFVIGAVIAEDVKRPGLLIVGLKFAFGLLILGAVVVALSVFV